MDGVRREAVVCVYSLSLHTQGTLVGIGASIAAAHRIEVQRTGYGLLHVRAGGLPGCKTTEMPLLS